MRKSAVFHRSSERGQAIVLMVLVFVGLLGIMGLAVDGGRLYMERRSVQNAADNAALAAAYALCSSSDVTSAAVASASQNGYVDSDDVDIVVQNPPSSGPNSGDDEYVAVVITSHPGLSIGRIVYSGNPEVSARAVARCLDSSGPAGWGNGLVALNPSEDNFGVNNTGTGCVVVTGGGIFVNSAHPSEAMIVKGPTGNTKCTALTRVKAEWIQVVGGVNVEGSGYMQPYPPQVGQAQRFDQLADVPVPARPDDLAPPPSVPIGCSYNHDSGGNISISTNCPPPNQVVIYPGRYVSLSISAQSNVLMQPGLYYIENNLKITGGGTVVGNGVTIYVDSGSVELGGNDNNGAVTLTAPTEGTYAGLVFFMGRGNSSDFKIAGTSSLSLSGTVYGPLTHVKSTGNGDSQTINGQFIADRFSISGDGRLNINYYSSLVYQIPGASKVQLAE